MLPSMVLSNLSIHSSKTGGEMDMNQIARNLICYPRIKMVSAAFAPFLQQNSQFEMNAFAMTSEIFSSKAGILCSRHNFRLIFYCLASISRRF
eukprot:UN10729